MAPLECREKWIPGLRLPAHPGMTKKWIASLSLAMTAYAGDASGLPFSTM